MNSYLAKFEALANRIVGIPTPFLLSCIISGLSPNIHREVLALQLLSLVQAVALARLQEDKINDARRSSPPRPPPLPPPSPLTLSLHQPFHPFCHPHQKPLTNPLPRLRWSRIASTTYVIIVMSVTVRTTVVVPNSFSSLLPRTMSS